MLCEQVTPASLLAIAEFFRRLSLWPGRVVARSELLTLSLSADFRFECGICERNYMLRRGCPTEAAGGVASVVGGRRILVREVGGARGAS